MKQQLEVLNTIALRAKTSIMKPLSVHEVIPDDYIDILDMELNNIGFRLSTTARQSLKNYSGEGFATIVDILYKECTDKIGAGRSMVPLFKDFPNQIPDTARKNAFSSAISQSLAEYIDALEKPEAIEVDGVDVQQILNTTRHRHTEYNSINHDSIVRSLSKSNTIGVVDINDIKQYISNVLSSNSSVSESDLEHVSMYLKNCTYDETLKIVPSEIPFKEHVAFFVSELIDKYDRTEVYELIKKFVKTGKDVMRVAEGLNSSEEKGFVLSNKKRKLIVQLLNDIPLPVEDMVKEREKWVELNMCVHFGTFKKSYPKAFSYVDRVLNRPETIRTFESKLQEALDSKDTNALVELCAQRPGIMGRNLDQMVRKNPDDVEMILSTFENVGSSISTRVLVTARNNFQSRINDYDGVRFYIDKKGRSQIVDQDREPISSEVCKKVIASIDNVMKQKLMNEEYKDKSVYVDPDLYNFKMPVRMRSSKNAINKAERGSSRKMDINNGSTIRLFTYWKESNDRVDLDLSVMLLDTHFQTIDECAYYNVRSSNGTMIHSGDVTSAPHGASEFIDIDVTNSRTVNGRYAVIYVNSFTNQGFDEFEAYTGTMIFNDRHTKSIYDPTMVDEKFDLTSDSKAIITGVYDLENNELVWADMSSHTVPASSMSSRQGSIQNTVEYLFNEKDSAMSIGDYFELAIEANDLVVVDTKSEADVVFDTEVVNNLEQFSKEWMK